MEHLGMGQIEEKVTAWRSAANAQSREKFTELMEQRRRQRRRRAPGNPFERRCSYIGLARRVRFVRAACVVS
eukprot:585469-Prymnesium_polylepis.1